MRGGEGRHFVLREPGEPVTGPRGPGTRGRSRLAAPNGQSVMLHRGSGRGNEPGEAAKCSFAVFRCVGHGDRGCSVWKAKARVAFGASFQPLGPPVSASARRIASRPGSRPGACALPRCRRARCFLSGRPGSSCDTRGVYGGQAAAPRWASGLHTITAAEPSRVVASGPSRETLRPRGWHGQSYKPVCPYQCFTFDLPRCAPESSSEGTQQGLVPAC